MKNIVSTMVVFGLFFLLIVVGAYIFEKFDGFGLIDKVDNSISNGIEHLLDDKNDNSTVNIKETLDNESNKVENIISDNNTTTDNVSVDNTTILN